MIVSITSISKDKLNDFDCGIIELNLFLKEYANQNDKKNISKTFVLYENDIVIGFYSLANAQIGFEYLNEDMKKKLPKYPIPSIRLTRLAVSKELQGKGYGSLLLKDAFLRIINVSKQTGLYFIIVDAKESAIPFYEHYGFIKLTSSISTYLIPISIIEKALNVNK